MVPSAEQKITYGMPTFKSTQNIFHFAAFKNHIGFYPEPDIILIFAEQLTDYKTSKGAIQFKLNEQLPLKLIEEMVQIRLEQIKQDQLKK